MSDSTIIYGNDPSFVNKTTNSGYVGNNLIKVLINNSGDQIIIAPTWIKNNTTGTVFNITTDIVDSRYTSILDAYLVGEELYLYLEQWELPHLQVL